MNLREKIAQLFILGFEGPGPNGVLEKFLNLSLGGVIFFRDNFQHMKDAAEVRAMLDGLAARVPDNLPRPFLSVDQEGGQVERLPHWLFSATVTPRAIGVSKLPEALSAAVYTLMGEQLANLGFNLNYFPTLDVNLNNRNPVIGVRSFGDDPETVWRLSKIAMACYRQAGVLTVGKHFPGHGNGTVDSHEKLPILKFTEAELSTFRKAVQNNVPCMMIAHGLYPGLQPEEEIRKSLPASASPFVIKSLLREQLNFNGVVMTDDLCMGAALGVPPEEAGVRALEAGADMLIYRQSTETEWRVLEAVVGAVESGRIPEAQIDASLARIATAKKMVKPKPFVAPEKNKTQQQAAALARESLTLLAGSFSGLSLHHQSVLLVHPGRAAVPNYAFDQGNSPELPECLRAAGVLPAFDICYTPQYETLVPDEFVPASVIVFVAFNAIRDHAQVRLYETLLKRYPQAPVVVVSAGTPDDMAVLPGAQTYVAACGYRPPVMKAIAELLSTVR